MTWTVHVLAPTWPLPHNQAFYDKQAADARHDLLSDADQQGDRGNGDSDRMNGAMPMVMVGHGAVSATAGGHSTLSVMRFMQDKVVIRSATRWNGTTTIR